MYTACIAVILTVLITIFMFLRSGSRDYAAAAAPLVIVPGAHILGMLLSVSGLFSISRSSWLFAAMALDVAGLAVSVALLTVCSRHIESLRARRAFLYLCTAFNTILTFILVANISVDLRADIAAQITEQLGL